MPKFKKVYRFVKGVNTEFDVHIDKDGKFFVKNPPKEIIETLKLHSIKADSFKDLEYQLTLVINDYHKALEKKRKVIIYRSVIGSSCEEDLEKMGIKLSKLKGRVGTSILGYGFQFDWIVAYELDLGNSKSYKRFMQGPKFEAVPDGPRWEDTPFEQLPQIGHIYDDQIIVEYSEDLENFFLELKQATIGLTAKLAKIFGNSPETLIENVNQRLLGPV